MRKQEKKKSVAKPKAKKLKITKKTVKDLDTQDASGVKGGVPYPEYSGGFMCVSSACAKGF